MAELTVNVNKAELVKLVELSERRRELLSDAINIISKIIGPDGVPKQKWKLVKKVTKIIQNMDDYEDMFSKITPEYVAEAFEICKKEE